MELKGMEVLTEALPIITNRGPMRVGIIFESLEDGYRAGFGKGFEDPVYGLLLDNAIDMYHHKFALVKNQKNYPWEKTMGEGRKP